MAIFNGRHTARLDGDFVVFLIGMRFNRPWKPRSWRVFMAMRPMVNELKANPQSGFLHAEYGFMFGGPALVQYWRTFDVGIWHETYRVHAGEYEVIYSNMPRVGLAAAGAHDPLGSASTAARRIGTRPEDRAPVAGY